MRLIPCLVLVAALSQGCKSCRQPSGPDGSSPLDRLGDAAETGPTAPDDAEEADLPEVDPAALGLESPDPDQDAVKLTTMFSPWTDLIKGDTDRARESIEEALEEMPGNLHVLLTKADLLLREDKTGEAMELIEQVLLSAYPAFSAKVLGHPSVKSLEKSDPDAWTELTRTHEAIRRAWAGAMSRPGVFLLVAPPFPKGNIADPEQEKLNRGWVVFLDATTHRFLPLTTRANVAGFILDRSERRLYTLSWKSHDREELDEEGEPIRPALLQGARVSYVDLSSFEQSRSVDLGADLVEARLSVRSGHVLASVVRLDFEEHEGKETSYEIDCEGFEAKPAPKAPPGPMDLIVAYGMIEPPTSHGFTEDVDTLPGGWQCIEPGKDLRLCAVPTSKDSVIYDLVLEQTSEEEKITLAEGIGILQMDVL